MRGKLLSCHFVVCSMKHLITLSIEFICLISLVYVAAGRENEVLQEVENVLRELKPAASVQHASPVGQYCNCIKYDCGCCIQFSLKEVKLINATACANVSYLPAEYGLSLVFTLNDVILYKKTISAKNPPPVCFGVPYLKKELSLCVDLYDLDYTKQYISGCMKLQIRIAYVITKSLDLGCFRIPLVGVEDQQKAAAVIQSIQAARLINGAF